MSKKSIIDKIKPEVRAISPYTLQQYEYEVKINQNENPHDIPLTLKQGILDFALKRSWSRYPPFVPDELYEKLAEYTGWKPKGILAGNGSNEIIQVLLAAFLKPGDKLVIPAPTFTLYRLMGKVFGANVVEIPLNSDYSYNCDALEREFLNGGAMLIICSPNNPTGTLFPQDRLLKLLEKTDCPIIVDEAYYEFSKKTAVRLLKSFQNLIILRTFSKAFSMAGLRLGYGLMDPDLAREVGKTKLPYNLNFFTIESAIRLLRNRAKLAKRLDSIVRARNPMIKAMNAINGVCAYPSWANFILFETPYNPATIFNELLADGILVRDVSSYPMLGKALRVSVSTPSDNRRFIRALKRIMNQCLKRGEP